MIVITLGDIIALSFLALVILSWTILIVWGRIERKVLSRKENKK